MGDNFISDVISDLKEIFLIAWKYFVIALVASFYVSYKTNFLSGLLIGCNLSFFAAIIGIEKYNVMMLEHLSESRRKVNDFHFNQLITDTEILSIIKKEITTHYPNDVRTAKSLLFLNRMIDYNNDNINTIKSLKNGGKIE